MNLPAKPLQPTTPPHHRHHRHHHRRIGGEEKRRADELQRRIDKALALVEDAAWLSKFPNPVLPAILALIL